ncbi:unnamed protein product [Spirodela intermedia]|uniref:HRDC domain-containing protein n=1 Tax=Spirodela intermedia TaxID=51605 RepID=A0A7I8KCG9_SPIIN|nr:unnamed protein product [Spirodela intermedia]
MDGGSASPPQESKADALLALVKGPLAASAARLSAQSRAVPDGRDFHFYRNFEQFRSPAREVAARSESLLSSIGTSELVGSGGKRREGSELVGLPEDLDDAHDWVVNLNDEILERFSASMDEFKSLREEEEQERGTAGDWAAAMETGGFQIVYGKKGKKKKMDGGGDDAVGYDGAVDVGGAFGVKVASRDKKTRAPRSQVPFHLPTIPRPQDAFKILVNNSNQPFEHVWLERSNDGSHFVHPLEKLAVLDFVDGNVGESEPMKPPPIEDTPFKLVEEVKDLKELAAKLRVVNEFAVDLEHNQYRSFQGLTCLMQISTRTEDFVVDTLKLRVHVGPYLREVFKDPSKRKVMHGADRDILWLQRDFGIYVCNLFDTGQASRVLQLERNSLEFLLQYFCGVTANKEYQQADWRLRPIPDDMLKYAREDTHYLLFMYDIMKRRLLSAESSNPDLAHSLLAEVYRRSSDICRQLYEKELLTGSSFLRIYGLSETDFSPEQLAVVAGLWEWRDHIARAEDESTGYILPNKALLEIARQMPLTSGMLKRLVKSKHPYVERNLGSVVAVIRNSVANAAGFEAVYDHLKKSHLEAAAAGGPRGDHPPSLPPPAAAAATAGDVPSIETPVTGLEIAEEIAGPVGRDGGEMKAVNVVSVQIKKKPVSAFGALFGGSSAKRKLAPDSKGSNSEQAKLEQIKSSVALPFHSFSGGAAVAAGTDRRRAEVAGAQPLVPPDRGEDEPAGGGAEVEDIIPLTDESEDPPADGGRPENGSSAAASPPVGAEEEEQPLSLSELSSSFEECFKAAAESRRGDGAAAAAPPQWKPFDYAAAREEVKFGDRRQGTDPGAAPGDGGGDRRRGKQRGNGGAAVLPRRAPATEDTAADFQAPRRCQAFPPSGNRSATFH